MYKDIIFDQVSSLCYAIWDKNVSENEVQRQLGILYDKWSYYYGSDGNAPIIDLASALRVKKQKLRSEENES